MRINFIAWVDSHKDEGDDIAPMVAGSAVAKLVRLQQFCVGNMELIGMKDDPRGRDNELGEPLQIPVYRMTNPSAKLDLVEEIIDQATGQVVVFSQFKQSVNLLGERLSWSGVPYRLLTSDVKQVDRVRGIEDFRTGRAKVFAATITAGGVGINLQTADTVIFIDRTWSPAKNFQAEDRVWRAGQKNTVQVIDIIAYNTIDLGRLQQIEDKWKALRQTLTDPRTVQRQLVNS
jgi:SNF2 family DNA or RNA helicase